MEAVPGSRRSRETRAESAAATLREEILSGRLPPGTPLRLEKLSRQLDMSVMPIREALKILESLGLVGGEPRRGARVSAVSLDDLHDTYEARLALEVLAIQRAAERFTPDHEERARAHLEAQMQEHGGRRDAHTAFHFELYSASGSAWLTRLIRPLWENSERYRIMSLSDRGSVELRREEHQRILDACVRHNSGAAARELHQHLALTANLVARQLGGDHLF